MINVTSQYPTQVFLSPGVSNIISQVDSTNSSNIPIYVFPKKYRRTSSAGTAPDGSGAAMSQIDVMVNPGAYYACQSMNEAQRLAFEAAGYLGNEYYIEVSPLTGTYYSILTWASNI